MLGYPPPAPPWGRRYLQSCGIDPDDPDDVRRAYEICHKLHGLWLWHRSNDIDAETWYTLVDAIRSLYGWDDFPLDWLPPIVVAMPRLRDGLLRTRQAGEHPCD